MTDSEKIILQQIAESTEEQVARIVDNARKQAQPPNGNTKILELLYRVCTMDSRGIETSQAIIRKKLFEPQK